MAGVQQYDLSQSFLLKTFELPFFTALLWSEIVELDDPHKEDYLERARVKEQLLRSGSPVTGFLFFSNTSQLPPEKTKLYPADVDDTAVIAEALMHLGHFNTKQLERIALLMLDQWSDDKNGFHVWIAENGERKSDFVDCIVNINVWRFLSHCEEYKRSSQLKIFESCVDLTHNQTTGYYTNKDFALWLKLRALRVLPHNLIVDVIAQNVNYLRDYSSSILGTTLNDVNILDVLELLKHDVKIRFEKSILFEHIGLRIGYKYPGPYYNLGLSHLARKNRRIDIAPPINNPVAKYV